MSNRGAGRVRILYEEVGDVVTFFCVGSYDFIESAFYSCLDDLVTGFQRAFCFIFLNLLVEEGESHMKIWLKTVFCLLISPEHGNLVEATFRCINQFCSFVELF